jgi:hypothetical protein
VPHRTELQVHFEHHSERPVYNCGPRGGNGNATPRPRRGSWVTLFPRISLLFHLLSQHLHRNLCCQCTKTGVQEAQQTLVTNL